MSNTRLRALFVLPTSKTHSRYSHLAITPAQIGPPQMHIWTVLTGCLVEPRWYIMLLNLAAVAYAGQIIEPLWGAVEHGKFVAVAACSTGLGAALTYIFIYAFSTEKASGISVLFHNFGGFWGVLAGYLVTFKQLYPQRKLALPGVKAVSVDCRLGPLLFCGSLAVLAAVTSVVDGSMAIMATNGAMWSWVYLRFYQAKDGSLGDPSESFTFVDFFPTLVQPVVSLVAGRVWSLAVTVRLCSNKPHVFDLSAPSAIKIALPGVTPSDADRRRNIALRDLNARTGSNGGGTVPPPYPNEGGGSGGGGVHGGNTDGSEGGGVTVNEN